MKRIVSLFAIAAMMCGTTAWAAPPDKEYIVRERLTNEFLTDCGDFEVRMDYWWEGYERSYFNRDGSLNRIFMKYDFPGGIYYNASNPSYWLAGTAEHSQSWIHFKDGEPVDLVSVGPDAKITVPGYGVVFINTGRFIWDFSEQTLTFVAGPLDWTRSWTADGGDFDALCAALRP